MGSYLEAATPGEAKKPGRQVSPSDEATGRYRYRALYKIDEQILVITEAKLLRQEAAL